jgi:very-short-patch-repair endonuclease
VRNNRAGNGNGTPPPLAGGWWGEGANRNTSLLAHARALRHASTPAERRLWQGRRKHQIGGLKFRRQIPLGRYIADFCCPSARVVVEADGVSHIDAPGDAVRDAWMSKHNIRVARISNRDVLRNLDGMLIAIGELARMSPPPNPLPQGEGESPNTSNSTKTPSTSDTPHSGTSTTSTIFLHV